MKKLYSLFSKILMSIGVLLVGIGVSSCATHRASCIMHHVSSSDSVRVAIDHRRDSIYIDRTHTLIQRGDTVFKTDSVYVEKRIEVEAHDTVTVHTVDSVPIPVEVPVEVEKPVPRFYKSSTIGFWLLLLAIISYIAIRMAVRLGH